MAVPISRIRVAPTAMREHAQQRADLGVDERQVCARAGARNVGAAPRRPA